MRATMSVGPPAAIGTRRRTGRLGQACACARRPRRLGANADAAAPATKSRRLIIRSSLGLSFADADAGLLDHRSPFVHFRPEELSELFGRRADHEQAELLQSPLIAGSASTATVSACIFR